MSVHLSPVRALVGGIIDVVRSPLMLIGIALITLIIAVPFAAVVQSRLQSSLSVQPHVNLDETEIDPEWWMEFRKQARGIMATFTPAVLGFAATLDGISGILDGRAIPAGIIAPLLLSMFAWAFMWGGVLERFRAGRGLGIGGFVRAGAAHFIPFALIAVIAAAINVILFVTVHRLLFGPVHNALVGLTSTERDAFFVRVVLYAIFFALIAAVSLVADYARVVAVVGRSSAPVAVMRTALAFIRTHVGGVAALFILTGLIFVVITIAYGTLEIVGGSEVGGWRAVAIGQAYVLVRLAIRLTFAASELRLFSANQTAAAE
jgi:hypothetical protein